MLKVKKYDYGLISLTYENCKMDCIIKDTQPISRGTISCAFGSDDDSIVCPHIDPIELAEFLQMLVRCPSGVFKTCSK